MTTTELCPRCEKGHFTPYDAPDRTRKQIEQFPYPALSRVANIYICSPCGTDEAFRDYAGAPPIGPGDWPVSE